KFVINNQRSKIFADQLLFDYDPTRIFFGLFPGGLGLFHRTYADGRAFAVISAKRLYHQRKTDAVDNSRQILDRTNAITFRHGTPLPPCRELVECLLPAISTAIRSVLAVVVACIRR